MDFNYFIYLFTNYNTNTNYILIIDDFSNFDLRPVSGGNQIHDPNVNCLVYYPPDYQGARILIKIKHKGSFISFAVYKLIF